MARYNAVVVGCGSIGALKDDKYDNPDDDTKILTFAHAFYEHHAFDLIGVVDTNIKKANEAAKKWKTKAYKDIIDIKRRIDVIAVCIDTKHHYSYLKSLLYIQCRPRTVIIEKPFCENLYQAEDIVKRYEEEGINLIVDYSRRFEPNIKNYKKLFLTKVFGEIFSCRISYTRGLFRDGCHAIDMCSYFFGEFEWAKVLDTNMIIDYAENDPTVNIIMSFKRCKNVFMNAVDGRDYAVFEFDILTSSGRITFKDYFGRICVYDTIPEPVYGNYKTLGNDYRATDTELHTMLLNVVDSVYKNFTNKTIFPCTGRDALETHRILNIIDYERRKTYGKCF